jgi:hypothetical protein
MLERAVTVLAHARADDLPDVITILCRIASWSAQLDASENGTMPSSLRRS